MTMYRVGIMGCGRIASTFEDVSPVHPASIAGAFAALPNARIVAAANRGRGRLEAFGKRWGVTALYHDYRKMLRREELDIVCVATHPELHAEMVVAAAETGAKGIFCEKPMSLSLGACDAMIRACEERGTKLLINSTRRWSGQYEMIRRLVERGDLGNLLHIVAHCEGCKPVPEWQADYEGPLLHDAVHTFDTMRFIAGDVEWVLGTATRRSQPFRVEDTSYSIIQFKNGVDGVVIVDELTEYERWDIECQFTRGMVKLGTNAGFWVSREEEFEKPWWYELVVGEMPPPAWEEQGILLAARDLIGAIEEGRECRCTGYDGRAAIEVIMAIYESERRGNTRAHLPLGVEESLVDVLRREGKF
ncbi:MAG: Gfo/Idh/MocA family oxidoreductase [Candidatus Latescibacteria bacterium]|nr:Gfo/Idh/MocA family oxidoreductase [Candidatus Latescibacterota bacterium]